MTAALLALVQRARDAGWIATLATDADGFGFTIRVRRPRVIETEGRAA